MMIADLEQIAGTRWLGVENDVIPMGKAIAIIVSIVVTVLAAVGVGFYFIISATTGQPSAAEVIVEAAEPEDAYYSDDYELDEYNGYYEEIYEHYPNDNDVAELVSYDEYVDESVYEAEPTPVPTPTPTPTPTPAPTPTPTPFPTPTPELIIRPGETMITIAYVTLQPSPPGPPGPVGEYVYIPGYGYDWVWFGQVFAARAVGVLPQGAVVIVMDMPTIDGWVQIQSDGMTGFVHETSLTWP